jgi:hypothetical protein
MREALRESGARDVEAGLVARRQLGRELESVPDRAPSEDVRPRDTCASLLIHSGSIAHLEPAGKRRTRRTRSSTAAGSQRGVTPQNRTWSPGRARRRPPSSRTPARPGRTGSAPAQVRPALGPGPALRASVVARAAASARPAALAQAAQESTRWASAQVASAIAVARADAAAGREKPESPGMPREPSRDRPAGRVRSPHARCARRSPSAGRLRRQTQLRPGGRRLQRRRRPGLFPGASRCVHSDVRHRLMLADRLRTRQAARRRGVRCHTPPVAPLHRTASERQSDPA